jgi:hypothetical protein
MIFWKHICLVERSSEDIANGLARGIVGYLTNEAKARALAERQVAAIGLEPTGEDFKEVDLPEPLGPMTPIRSPSETRKERLWKRGEAPNRLASP